MKTDNVVTVNNLDKVGVIRLFAQKSIDVGNVPGDDRLHCQRREKVGEGEDAKWKRREIEEREGALKGGREGEEERRPEVSLDFLI